MFFIHLLRIFLIFGVAYASENGNQNKIVATHLNAKWANTPLLLEAAEYMADESPAIFWTFVEYVSKWDLHDYAQKNEKNQFDELLSSSSKILSTNQLELLQLSLALRVHSPKIEMFRQIALDRGILNRTDTQNCQAVIDVNGHLICGVKSLKKSLGDVTGIASHMAIYDVDHHYPGGESNKLKVVLYAEIGTLAFSECHSEMVKLVDAGEIDYILRPYVQSPGSQRVRLSGYGVELAIKSTEYKAQDDTKLEDEESEHQQQGEDEQHTEGFLFSTLRTRYPELSSELSDFKKHLVSSSHDMAPMKVWQLQHLSMQAAQRVLSSGEPLEKLNALVNTAQDFPRLARSLVKIKVDDKMKREILKNQNYLRSNHDVGPSDAAVFINGMHFDMDYTDIFTLLDHVKNEQRAMEGLSNLGVSGPALTQLLSLESGSAESARGGMTGPQPAPEYGLDIRDTAIIWLNNIETDSTTKKWPSSVNELLRPSYPGMLRSIRRNFHNLVLVVDPLSAATSELFVQVNSFLSHNAPLRIGLVFSVSADKKVTGLQDAGVAVVCAFNYVVQSYDGEEANMKGFNFLQDLYSAVGSDLTVDTITSFFKQRYKSEDIDDVFGDDSDFDVGRRVAREFIEKGGFKSVPQALMNGVPLPSKHLSGDEFEEVMLMEVMRNTQVIQRAVYRGELNDRQDVTDWLMAAPNIMPRLNERILNSKSSRSVDTSSTTTETLSHLSSTGAELKSTLDALPLRDVTGVLDNTCHYISTKTEPAVRPLTLWVIGDYDTPEGRDLLLEAVKYTRESDSVRLCAIHHRNTSAAPSTSLVPLSHIIEVAHSTLPSPVARQLLVKILDSDFVARLAAGEKAFDQIKLNGFDHEAFEARLKSFSGDAFKLHASFSSRVVGVPGGSRVVVANGRVLGPLDPDEIFVLEDFALLEKHTAFTLTDKITEIMKDSTPDPSGLSSLIMKVSGVIQTKPQTKSRTSLELRGTEHSTFTIEPRRPELPSFDVVAACDPVSLAAQKMGPVLQVLHKVLNAKITVVLNAIEKHSEMPLKSFYRVVLEAAPQFHAKTGARLPGPSAVFSWLPETPILTQNFHVPDNWLVEVVRSKYDLDNIKLELVESNVVSEYELENLLVEGHCFEQSTGNPPRGLQFTLGTQHDPVMVDTIVMANLGYFQLKANPGAWHLDLREGRSKDLYGITSHEGTDTPSGSSAVQVLVSSFRSHVVKVRVAKLPGKQDMDLLNEDDKDDEAGGLWNTITSTFSSGEESSDASVSGDSSETINIFSVASGHLYERFLRIMMVSVRKHTNSPVKFWFLKNFLSPSLKDSLPILAQEYGFAYELVQYKWPRWLHQQTEKQRIIWGYKILFLDVLFPLHVKKIIFVDADQVVRADIKELHDLNLEGAPYGFVPFCDSRKEMEGFRFWKHGYWRNHLGGRKYHISALFVVDLRKFRRIAAGDRLRGQYQGLSQDPNSLSNLDQDLPNNMIHQVRIKSLPMEWLWCETWCDDESKKYAKVIDVCNNPQTKEAKLVAAERIIDEWTQYDQDIKSVLARHKETSSKKTSQPSKPPPVAGQDVHVEL
ncbi:UDP-glucose:glycoprotein glucosyltransferase 1 isoform X2 [Hyalella azteca]|uniref:UDP-glucose:glycoprotein glucosyltransferase 1 isoform X2 n=1 Tax=Hyalella azteca TaxID=294128 RepID=A0A8B7PL56_HYAAZ|nr:UDP-glucose:glycoprotein glucosyltransferase 1 isoform X2 [Hyalella azteca]